LLIIFRGIVFITEENIEDCVAKFRRQFLFDPLISVVWRQTRALRTEERYPLNRQVMKKLQVFVQF